ncbi:MAG: hypothetical protein ACE5HV_09390 [Acidobacteriota bacterium]
MIRARPRGGILVFWLCLLALPASASAAQNQPGVRLVNAAFDWLDASEDTATFEWSVDVVNETREPHRVRVILELLDDDDQVVNRDEQGTNSDMVTIKLGPGERQTIEQRGELPYDRAAEVVSFRHRRELADKLSP